MRRKAENEDHPMHVLITRSHDVLDTPRGDIDTVIRLPIEVDLQPLTCRLILKGKGWIGLDRSRLRPEGPTLGPRKQVCFSARVWKASLDAHRVRECDQGVISRLFCCRTQSDYVIRLQRSERVVAHGAETQIRDSIIHNRSRNKTRLASIWTCTVLKNLGRAVLGFTEVNWSEV